MSYESNLDTFSLPVAADSSSNQYRFHSVNASGQMALTGAGAQADGVLQDTPGAAGRAGAFVDARISKVACGGTCTRGALGASDANGKAVDAGTGDNPLCVFLETGASGEVVAALLKIQSTNAIA